MGWFKGFRNSVSYFRQYEPPDVRKAYCALRHRDPHFFKVRAGVWGGGGTSKASRLQSPGYFHLAFIHCEVGSFGEPDTRGAMQKRAILWKKENNRGHVGLYDNRGTPNIDPQIVGPPYLKDPNKVPPILGNPLALPLLVSFKSWHKALLGVLSPSTVANNPRCAWVERLRIGDSRFRSGFVALPLRLYPKP